MRRAEFLRRREGTHSTLKLSVARSRRDELQAGLEMRKPGKKYAEPAALRDLVRNSQQAAPGRRLPKRRQGGALQGEDC